MLTNKINYLSIFNKEEVYKHKNISKGR